MPSLVEPRQQRTLAILKFGVSRASMITTAQIRAGRGLLKWTQATLAVPSAPSDLVKHPNLGVHKTGSSSRVLGSVLRLATQPYLGSPR